MTKEEKMAALQNIVADCAAKEKATEADLEELKAKKPATSPTAKCHRACLHENFGTVSSIKGYRDLRRICKKNCLKKYLFLWEDRCISVDCLFNRKFQSSS